jgi:hypothetical protein
MVAVTSCFYIDSLGLSQCFRLLFAFAVCRREAVRHLSITRCTSKRKPGNGFIPVRGKEGKVALPSVNWGDNSNYCSDG